MTFSELIKLYKEGTLPEKEKKMLEAEIEKYDAISNYLCEESEIPALDSLCIGDDSEENEQQKKQSEQFAKMINSAVRRIFARTGIIVGAVVLAVVLAVVYVLPNLVSSFYYNPNEVIAVSDYGNETTRMELDIGVYTELFMPCMHRGVVIAESEGYGEYAITIPQSVSYTGQFNTIVGRLEKGELTLYTPDLLRHPTGNAFVLPMSVKWNFHGMGAAGEPEYAFAALNELDEHERYIGYFSLDGLWEYERFYEEFGEYAQWTAIYEGTDQSYMFGFLDGVGGAVINWDKEKYPLLSSLGYNGPIDFSVEENAKTHFLSMLYYLRDYPEIAEMFDNSLRHWDEVIEYIEQNELQTYGFAVVGDRDIFLEIAEKEGIAYVYTTPMR